MKADWLATINFVVAIFNLIPGFPMDGGRVFRALVWGITGDAVKGMRWAVVSGKIVAYILMLIGAVIALQPGMLLNGLWIIAIGWFLITAAEGSKHAYLIEHLAGHVTAGDILQKEVPTISADMTILNWIDERMLLTGQRACLVTENNQTVGLVTLSDVIKCRRDQWPRTPVREIMTPAKRLHMVKPSNSILEVLQIMRQQSINQVPVVVDEKKIVGWIDREHLLKILQLHAATDR